MEHELVSARIAACVVGSALAICLVPFSAVTAFPTADPSNQSLLPGTAPFGVELQRRDVEQLQAQRKLTNQTPTLNAGWTIIPRITLQEMFTDNTREVKAPRRFDAITVIAPGISITADTPRVQLRLDYQPNLLLHALDGPLNAVTQQFSATGLFTVVPDLAYVDVRGISGVQSRLGGLSGGGLLGSSDAGTITTGSVSTVPVANGSGQGLNRQNEVQTSSFGISPYLLRRFGDYGTGKLGVSVDASSYSNINGFIGNPLPFANSGGQSVFTTEQIARFSTGEFLGRFQDTISADLTQSRIRSQGFNGAGSSLTTTTTSRREIFNNQVSYALNRTFTVLGSVGHEHIQYSQTGYPKIDGITWNAGVTITPNPDSSVTLTYGHQNGGNAFSANGHYALTGRTLLSFDYSNTIGTQLENLQSQLNNSSIINAQPVNVTTGGQQFLASNANGVQNGLFRYKTFNASLQTTLPRDVLTASFVWSDQTSLGGGGYSVQSETAALTWAHELAPDLTLSAGAGISRIKRGGSIGNDTSWSTAVGLRYALNDSTTLSARYSFFDRISGIPGYSIYENIVLVGITKQF